MHSENGMGKLELIGIVFNSVAVLAFFCKFEFSMIKYSVLWAGMAIFWLSCLIVI